MAKRHDTQIHCFEGLIGATLDENSGWPVAEHYLRWAVAVHHNQNAQYDLEVEHRLYRRFEARPFPWIVLQIIVPTKHGLKRTVIIAHVFIQPRRQSELRPDAPLDSAAFKKGMLSHRFET